MLSRRTGDWGALDARWLASNTVRCPATPGPFWNESAHAKLNPGSFASELRIRQSKWTPSIVPSDEPTVYLVADDFGRAGSAWRETDLETADLETVIQDLLAGEYKRPIRVVAFNTAERWAEYVSEDVAREIQRRCDLQLADVPSHLQEFVDRHAVQDIRQLTLRLV
jgi:hypothetical protein